MKKFKPFKIVLPGDVPVKKNTMGHTWHRKDKNGNRVPLDRPLTYYLKPFKTWVNTVVPYLTHWKEDHASEYDFPLKGKYVITFMFFRKRKGTVDLSALYEGPQDLLQGKVGNTLDKIVTQGGFKTKVKFNHDKYKIFHDDDCDTMANHGASTVLYSDKPHLEIFVSEYKHSHIGFLMNTLHPGLMLGDFESEEKEEQQSMFGSDSDAWKDILRI